MLKQIILSMMMWTALLAFGSCSSTGTSHDGQAPNADTMAEAQMPPQAQGISMPEIMFPGPLDPVWGDDEVMLLAVANLGDIASIEQLHASPFYPLFKSLYPEIESVKKIEVNTGSGQLWYVEPLAPGMSLAINEYDLAMFNGEKSENDGKVYYRTEDARPMLLRMSADDPGSVKINVVDNEGHNMSWIPTMSPADNVLRAPDEVTDITYHPIDWVAELGRDYTCDMGGKQVTLRFYGNGILAINGKLGQYVSYHTTHNDALALYYRDANGREGTALLSKWEQDDRAFNMSNYSGYDLGLGKLATFLPQ